MNEPTNNRPLADFDPLSTATLSCPFAYWSALRREASVHRFSLPGSEREVYYVSRREDVQQVVLDTETYASVAPSDIWRWGDLGPEWQPLMLAQGWGIVHTIASADPPLHGLYRRIVNPLFSPKKVASLVPPLQLAVDTLLDAIPRGQPFDFVRDFAVPLPIWMIADMLGVPAADRSLVRRYTDAFVGLVDPTSSAEKTRQSIDVFTEGQHYLAGFIARCEQTPDDTMLSAVANATDDDGNRLSMEERLSLAYLLLAAGNETSRNALSLAAWQLAIHPELWRQLKADRTLAPVFVEEALRIGTPAKLNPRTVTRDTELAGVQLKKGAVVFIIWGSANRDERVYADADAIRLDRDRPRSHLAFGYGIHACVGAPLARQELLLSVQGWLERFEHWSLAVPQEDVALSPLFGISSFPALPLVVG